MVRNYKTKKDTKLLKLKIEEAILKIEVDNLSIRAAARTVDIPFSTLYDYMKTVKNQVVKKSVGAPLCISESSENELASCLKSMAKWGFPLSRAEIKQVVGDFVTENKQGTSDLSSYLNKYCHFKNNIPGEEWLSSFLSRHNLTSKKPCGLEKSRVVATSNPFLIFEFYDLLETEMNVLNLKNKPSHIFNLDETAMFLDPSRGKAVGEKGKSLARLTAASGRESATILACVNAAGDRHPPLIIFSGKKLQSTWNSAKIDRNLTIAISETGWMTTDIFESWFDIFCKQVLKRPLIIIYDGHKTHLSLNLIHKARNEGICILKLPAHTTDILQPLDKCCFKPLKTQWDKKLVEVQRLSGGAKISKSTFTELVDEIWPLSLTPSNIKAGFKFTGIYPVDRTKYPEKRFCSRMLESYKIQNSLSKGSVNALNYPNTQLLSIPYSQPSVLQNSSVLTATANVGIGHQLPGPSSFHTSNMQLLNIPDSQPFVLQNSSVLTPTSNAGNGHQLPGPSSFQTSNMQLLNIYDSQPSVSQNSSCLTPTTNDGINHCPSGSSSSSYQTPIFSSISPKSFEYFLSKRLHQTPGKLQSEVRRRINTNSAVITSQKFLDLIEVQKKEIQDRAIAKEKRRNATNEKRQSQNQNLCTKKNTTKKQKVDGSDSDPDDPEDCIETAKQTESREKNKVNKQLSKNTPLENAKRILKNIHKEVQEQVYYAVYYDKDPYYIGKVTKVLDKENVEMKFLEKGAGNFRWPKRNIVENIRTKCIFYGPVKLQGSNPFVVDSNAIHYALKCYKQFFQEIWM